MLTKQYLDELFDYRDGSLYWKKSRSNIVKVGDKVGCMSGNGYLDVRVDGKLLKVHRIIFVMHHGYEPKMLDHINADKTDNRIENLRECVSAENVRNRPLNKNNTTGSKGVVFNKRRGKYMVRVSEKYLGYYEDLELADLVATMAREKYHGKFARHC
jgi:HNH endonuclease